MELPPEDRGLGELRAFFDNEPEGAGARLDKWCWGGELGWVIDAPVDTVRFGQLNGLDTTALLENERARGPALAYLYHRISLLLDGTPLLIPCDEGWRALIDPTFRGIIEKQLRTIRSRNGAVVFITQSPRDIIDSGIVNILVEQCPSQFHLANPRGTREDYVDGLKLTAGNSRRCADCRAARGCSCWSRARRALSRNCRCGGSTASSACCRRARKTCSGSIASRSCRHFRGNAGGGGMTRARRVLLGAAAGIALAAGYSTPARADLPVIDTAALGQWAQQLAE